MMCPLFSLHHLGQNGLGTRNVPFRLTLSTSPISCGQLRNASGCDACIVDQNVNPANCSVT